MPKSSTNSLIAKLLIGGIFVTGFATLLWRFVSDPPNNILAARIVTMSPYTGQKWAPFQSHPQHKEPLYLAIYVTGGGDHWVGMPLYRSDWKGETSPIFSLDYSLPGTKGLSEPLLQLGETYRFRSSNGSLVEFTVSKDNLGIGSVKVSGYQDNHTSLNDSLRNTTLY